jgi:hypothetical protein
MLEAETTIPTAAQQVVFNGKELGDKDVLSACGRGLHSFTSELKLSNSRTHS